jgi:hypothetical protein
MALIDQEQAAKQIRGNKEYVADCEWLKGYNKACEDNAQIVEQMKTEKCKWIRYDYRTICPKNHDIDNPYWRIPEKTECLKYCPYCGKEIEVEK